MFGPEIAIDDSDFNAADSVNPVSAMTSCRIRSEFSWQNSSPEESEEVSGAEETVSSATASGFFFDSLPELKP